MVSFTVVNNIIAIIGATSGGAAVAVTFRQHASPESVSTSSYSSSTPTATATSMLMTDQAVGIMSSSKQSSILSSATAIAARSQGSFATLQTIVKQLDEMLTTVQNENEVEKDLYSKQSCYCKTNGNEKEEAIANSITALAQLESDIQSAAGIVQEKQETIKLNEEQLEVVRNDLETAHQVFQKDQDQFRDDSFELANNVDSLNRAIQALGAYYTDVGERDAAEQTRKEKAMTEAKAMADRPAASLLSTMFSNDLINSVVKLSRTHLDAVESDRVTDFLQQQKTAVPGDAVGAQSGQIVGILQQMHSTMEADLTTMKEAFQKTKANYEELTVLKEAAETELQTTLEADRKILAENQVLLTEGHLQVEATQKKLRADQEFLASMQKTCASVDEVYQANQAARADELQAIQGTVEYLNSDEARSIFTDNKESFIQTASEVSAENLYSEKSLQKVLLLRNRVSGVLKAAFKKSGDMVLLSLSSKMKLDAFSQVKQEIEKLIASIKQELEDNVKERDICLQNIMAGEKQEAILKAEFKTLQAKIGSLEDDLKTHEVTLVELQTDLDETRVSLQDAGANVAAESKEYKSAQQDTQAMIKVLGIAKEKLAAGYQTGVALVQQDPAEASQGVAIKKYKANASGNAMNTLFMELIQDMQAELKTGTVEEQNRWNDYSKMASSAFTTLDSVSRDLHQTKRQKVDTETALVNTQSEMKDTFDQLETAIQTLGSERQTCGFLLTNFDSRQDAMGAEISALQEAIGILSGSGLAEDLQE